MCLFACLSSPSPCVLKLCAMEILVKIKGEGGGWWIENKILAHFDFLMFEIGLLDAEKIKITNVD